MPDALPGPEYLNLVYSVDWDSILPDMLIHAGEYYPYLPVADWEEYVQAAVVKVLNGNQPWNPAARPDIRKHIAWVLRSVISNERKRLNRQAPSISTDDGLVVNPVDLVADPDPTIEEELIAKERVERIRQAVEGDEEAEFVLMAIEDGKTKPSEIAEATEIEPKKIYTILRRIRRRAAKLPQEKKVS